MALQFVIGGSGSGKTRYLYNRLIKESMEQPGQQFFAIVPEQFTMQTQREIVALHPSHGVMNVDIVSFNRLAYRVFEELAVLTPTVLDDMGKSMVLRKVAANKKKELVLFQNHLNKNGFISQLKSMLSEFYQYGVSPDDLEGQFDKLEVNPLLSQKMHDVDVMYRGFQEYIAKRFITAEEILDVLCKELPNSKILKDSIVTLDGFTGFTPVQCRLLKLMMIHCREVIITMTMDPEANPYIETGDEDLFHMSRHTICRLMQAARDAQVPVRGEVRLNARPYYRFRESQALDFLERNFLRYPIRSFEDQQDSIRLHQAMNPGREVEDVVEEICRLVSQEGFRYRDVAVITGDLPGYSEKLVYHFDKHGIPYFMDAKKSIIGNPMVELIRAALEVVQKDFSYESVFRYLKTGLVTDDREIVCRMENYVLVLGIRGYKRWSREWDMTYYQSELVNLARINEFREELLGPLAAFRDVVSERTSDVKAMTGAVVHLLEELHIEEKLLQYEAHFADAGQHSLAKEYSQVYGLVMELMDRLVGLLGDEVMGRKEYADILDAGFQEIKVGLIPATLDRVVVGDITRTRIDHVKVLFFMGFNDGIIPSAKESGGVLTEQERELLKQQLELAPTAREDGFMQRFYLYLMMTKPDDRLYLSYCAASSDGKTLRPSYLVNTMRKMYPDIGRDRMQGMPAMSPELGKRRLAEGLKEYEAFRQDLKFHELFGWYYRSEKYHDYVELLTEAAFYSYEEKGIGKAAAQALYGTVLSGSVTRLEQYAACAYAHFLKYGLELSERKEYELVAMDIGNLFHASIDLFFKEMKSRGDEWSSLTDSARKELVKACVGQVTADYGNTIFQSSARNAYLVRRVERITDRTMWALAHQIQKGDFEPAAFEVTFSPLDNLKAMRLSLSEKEELQLKGRIDRLDICREDDRIYVKIIDYKSGGTSFDLSSLYYGLQLQLVVYMDAVLELEERRNPGKEIVPAGIFYYNINDPMVDLKEDMSQEEIEKQMLRQLRMNGLVNSDLDVIRHLDRDIETESDVIPVALKAGIIQESRSNVAGGDRFDALRTFVREKLKTVGQEILEGSNEVVPYKQGQRSACDYCPYHAVCGFDLKTPGYRFKRLSALKSGDIWQKIVSPPPDGRRTEVVSPPPCGRRTEVEGGGEDGSPVDEGSAESH